MAAIPSESTHTIHIRVEDDTGRPPKIDPSHLMLYAMCRRRVASHGPIVFLLEDLTEANMYICSRCQDIALRKDEHADADDVERDVRSIGTTDDWFTLHATAFPSDTAE